MSFEKDRMRARRERMSNRLEMYPLSAKRLNAVLQSGEDVEEAQSYWEDYLWDGDTFDSEDEAPDDLWERLCGELAKALSGGPAASGESAYAIASIAFGLRSGERTVCGGPSDGSLIDEGIRLAGEALGIRGLVEAVALGWTPGLTLGPITPGVVAERERISLGCLSAAEVASGAARLGAREPREEDFVDFVEEPAAVRDCIHDAFQLAARQGLDLFVIRRNH
jgi:hypothetical protein